MKDNPSKFMMESFILWDHLSPFKSFLAFIENFLIENYGSIGITIKYYSLGENDMKLPSVILANMSGSIDYVTQIVTL